MIAMKMREPDSIECVSDATFGKKKMGNGKSAVKQKGGAAGAFYQQRGVGIPLIAGLTDSQEENVHKSSAGVEKVQD